jgi:hypothetical protein
MNRWDLVASLPYLRFGEKPPMGRVAFESACASRLDVAEMEAVRAALENRCPPGADAVALEWWNGEVLLRNAVIRLRAKNRSADAARFTQPCPDCRVWIERRVTDAFTRADPLEQEADLDRARWALADELALSGPFAFPGILAFAVKLRIAERWAGLDDEKGRKNVEELILASVES